MSKEEIEIKKLELEVKKLKQPMYKNPAYLTIIVSIILGLSSYFVLTDQAKAEQIVRLKAENENLEDQKEALEKTRIELKADHYQRQYEDFKFKTEEIAREIQLKEMKLISYSDKVEQQEILYSEFKKKLNKVQTEYAATKEEYERYKERVREVIDEVGEYGPNYAKGLIKSPSGQQQIQFIISQNEQALIKSEIERFAFGISKQAFDQSLVKKKLDLNIN